MRRALDIQTWGSALVISAFIAAEIAAHALDRFPGSPLAWAVNLQLFRPFEGARVEASPLRFLFGPGALPAALGLLALTLLMRRLRFRLGVAVAANLSFVFAIALAWTTSIGPAGEQVASLGPSGLVRGVDGLLVSALLAASFVAFALSHLSFVVAIAGERRGRVPAGSA